MNAKKLLRNLKPEGFTSVRPGIKMEWGGSIIVFSIQAGPFHYCKPRTDQSNLLDYETVEVAIFEDDGKGSWLKPKDIDCAPLMEYDNDSDDVMGYVPIEAVISGIEYMLNNNGATLV